MRRARNPLTSDTKINLLLSYVADLELEVDRLRKQSQFVEQEVRATLDRILQALKRASDPEALPNQLSEIDKMVSRLAAVLVDLHDPPGYHPAHDQVVAIAVRPVTEQVFRRQQRLEDAQEIALRFELETEHMEWFPARLRHILENLISNSVKYRDLDKGEAWVSVGLREVNRGYELQVADNGVGIPTDDDRVEVLDLFYRAAPARAAGLGVGLAVVKMLVEQSGGSLTVQSNEGQGTTFVVFLPRFDVDDFLI